MTKSYKKRKNKKILALFLSSFMVVTAAASFAACGNDENSSTDDSHVTDTETDTARIANGSFEFYDDNNGRNLIITSPTGEIGRFFRTGFRFHLQERKRHRRYLRRSMEKSHDLLGKSALHKSRSRSQLERPYGKGPPGILRSVGKGKRRQQAVRPFFL